MRAGMLPSRTQKKALSVLYNKHMGISEAEKRIIKMIREEATRVDYGKLTVELTVHDKKITNVQSEYIRRSMNVNYDPQNVGKRK